MLILTSGLLLASEPTNITIGDFQCYVNYLLRISHEIVGRLAVFDVIVADLGYKKCADSITDIVNGADQNSNLTGSWRKTTSIVNERKCVWEVCWDLEVKLKRIEYFLWINFFNRELKSREPLLEHHSGCDRNSKYKTCPH